MALTRPEASETTGTLRDTSGVTVPVTTNSEVAGRAVDVARGNCSGWSTLNRPGSAPGTMLAGGGAPASAAAWALTLPQPARISNEETEIATRAIRLPLSFIAVQFAIRNISITLVKPRASKLKLAHKLHFAQIEILAKYDPPDLGAKLN